jgi:hypothetical protein
VAADGAKSVLLIGAPANRLEVSRRMGADAVLNMDDVPDPRDRIICVALTGVRSASVTETHQGKTITVTIGLAPGGSYCSDAAGLR